MLYNYHQQVNLKTSRSIHNENEFKTLYRHVTPPSPSPTDMLSVNLIGTPNQAFRPSPCHTYNSLPLTHNPQPIIGAETDDLHFGRVAAWHGGQHRLHTTPHRQHRARQHMVLTSAQTNLAGKSNTRLLAVAVPEKCDGSVKLAGQPCLTNRQVSPRKWSHSRHTMPSLTKKWPERWEVAEQSHSDQACQNKLRKRFILSSNLSTLEPFQRQ